MLGNSDRAVSPDVSGDGQQVDIDNDGPFSFTTLIDSFRWGSCIMDSISCTVLFLLLQISIEANRRVAMVFRGNVNSKKE